MADKDDFYEMPTEECAGDCNQCNELFDCLCSNSGDRLSVDTGTNKQAELDREKHTKIGAETDIFPLLWIRDKESGKTHLYGTDSHDSLYIGDDGQIHYHNLQNGDGTGSGEGYGYEFVSHDLFGMRYDDILHFYKDDKSVQ